MSTAQASPTVTVRIASYNLNRNAAGIDRTAGALGAIGADVVCLQEMAIGEIGAFGDALKLPHVARPADPPAGTPFAGVCILSRHPLTAIREVRTTDSHTFAIMAVVNHGEATYVVVAVHLKATVSPTLSNVNETERRRNEQLMALLSSLDAYAGRPVLVAGDFNQPPVGRNYRAMADHFTDVLAATGGTYAMPMGEARIDYVFANANWRALGGTVEPSDASDHRPIWADVMLGPLRK